MPVINVDHKNIFYRVSGQGPVVMLLHGFGENGDVFLPQINFLRDRFRVIVPDLPGSGQSEPLENQPSLDDFAEIIYQIANKEIPEEKFNLFGHSMGGYTTMAFVDRHLDCLKSFGLLHSSAFADTEEKKEIRKKAIAFIAKNGGHTFLKTITADLFSEESKSRDPDLVPDLLALADNISDKALVQYYRSMIARPDRSPLLVSSPVPVFFLVGKYDKVVPLELAIRQSQMPQKSKIQILEHSAHMGIWEESQLANRALSGFLEDFH